MTYEDALMAGDARKLYTARQIADLQAHDTIAMVAQFMLTAGQEVKPRPGQPTPEVLRLRLSICLEELQELSHAFGLDGSFRGMLEDMANDYNLELDTHVYDAVEVLDALTDMRYVADGTVLACGLQDVFIDAFANVQASNMSKFPDSAALAQASCTAYGDQGIDTGYKPAGTTGRYVIHRLGDGKVLKSKDYIPASLGPILEKHSAK